MLVTHYSVSSLPVSSPPLSFPSSAIAYLVPARSSPSYYIHLLATHVPGIRTISSHRYIIGPVAMYYVTVFFLFVIYSAISSNPASCIAVSRGG